MDKQSNEHNFGNAFLKKVLSKVPTETISQSNLENDYEVLTEHKERGHRFDILVKGMKKDKKGIIFENKIKSFGLAPQLDSYKGLGYEVIILAFLPETIHDEVKRKHPVITYSDIKDILKTFELSKDNKYHLFIEDYITYLENSILVYDNLKDYLNLKIDFDSFRFNISGVIQNTKLLDNDIRTFNYFYYFNFDQYLQKYCPELVFGTLSLKEAEESKGNTRWLYEKNLQGIPFMEALLSNPYSTGIRYRMHDVFKEAYEKEPHVMVPRIELWLDLKLLFVDNKILPENRHAGAIMFGSWNKSLKDIFRAQHPYSKWLKRRGSRNDHYENIIFGDLPFTNLAKRIMDMLMLIGNFQ